MITEWWEVRCQLAVHGKVLNPDLWLAVAYQGPSGDMCMSDEFPSWDAALMFAAQLKVKFRVVHCVIVTEG